VDINPYDTRQRILQAQDQVQVQREVAPDAELAGCPGCPYFWTCPVPHRGEEVRAPQEIHLEDVTEEVGERRPFRPHDESDIGWTDVWIEDDEHDDPVADAKEHGDPVSDVQERGDPAADAQEHNDPAADAQAHDGPAGDAATPPRRWWRRRPRRG
jgi:hypothetical protein